jgi:transposase
LFRKFLEKSDFNSPFFQESTAGALLESSFPFIASHQWRILEPLLPPPERRSPRGRPNADPRALLDAIFWKVAHHARWQDLPAVYPPMLTCRRYYRRLFRSGRLVTLYNTLYQHLVTSGNVDLLDFVNRGFFSIRQNKVILAPGNGNTWQLHTALLFLQFGIQELRQSRREIVLEQRARFPTFEALMKRKRAMQAPPPGLDEPVYTPFDFGSSRIVCSKNRDMASSNFHAGRGHAFLGLRVSSEQAPLDSPGYRKDFYVPFFERTESDQQVIMKTGPFSPPGKGATTLSRRISGKQSPRHGCGLLTCLGRHAGA